MLEIAAGLVRVNYQGEMGFLRHVDSFFLSDKIITPPCEIVNIPGA